jgi:hypothetical protein
LEKLLSVSEVCFVQLQMKLTKTSAQGCVES